MKSYKKLILGSASPRRRELLTQMGLHFEIIPSRCEEKITKQIPAEVVMELAYQKANDVAMHMEEDVLVLGADTIVVFDGNILGKPKNEQDAIRMLTMLSGNTHSVYTGVALVDKKGQAHVFYEETKVVMHTMDEEEIGRYVKSGDPMDKAGSYGIQGQCAVYIEKIDGDYNNVVGLPIARIYQEMKKLGIEIL